MVAPNLSVCLSWHGICEWARVEASGPNILSSLCRGKAYALQVGSGFYTEVPVQSPAWKRADILLATCHSYGKAIILNWEPRGEGALSSWPPYLDQNLLHVELGRDGVRQWFTATDSRCPYPGLPNVLGYMFLQMLYTPRTISRDCKWLVFMIFSS